MKKTTKYLAYGACGVIGMALIGIGQQVNPAQAACAYNWASGDEVFISACSGVYGDGVLESTIDDKVITLKMNNYRGDALEFENAGTALSLKKIVVELSGENMIDAGDKVAFDLGMPVEFTGEGSLTIRSTVPFLSNDLYVVDGEERSAAEILKEYRHPNFPDEAYVSEVVINPSQTTPTTPVESDEGSSDNQKCPPAKEEDNTFETVMFIIGGIYIVGSLVAFAVMAARHFAKKSPETTRSDKDMPQIPGPEV